MKISLIPLLVLLSLLTFPASSFAVNLEKNDVLLQAPPVWNVGDTWNFEASKNLDRIITQNLGMLAITMSLNKMETSLSQTVTGIETVDEQECYTLKVEGTQNLTGTYETAQAQGEPMRGNVLQKSAFEGIEYRRVADLAFVKSILKAKGTIEIGGILQGFPVPFQSDSISIAKPALRQFSFPLSKNDSWRVSSVVTTTTTGTSTDTIVNSFNYDCRVVGSRPLTTSFGITYDTIVIQQEGVETTQSQNAGVNIDQIGGNLFFAPAVGNVVLDETENQELIKFIPAGTVTEKTPPEAAQAPDSK